MTLIGVIASMVAYAVLIYVVARAIGTNRLQDDADPSEASHDRHQNR